MIRSPIVAPYDSTPARAASSPWCNSIVAPRTLVKNVAHGWREARRRAAKRLLGGGLVAIVTSPRRPGRKRR